MTKITLDNIFSFALGNINYYKKKLGILPKHQEEQALYRLSKCKNDCVIIGKCIFCNCPTERKVFAPKSCNKGKRFPDYMGEEEWYEFKKEKGIDGNFEQE